MSLTVSGQTACQPCLDIEGYARTLSLDQDLILRAWEVLIEDKMDIAEGLKTSLQLSSHQTLRH